MADEQKHAPTIPVLQIERVLPTRVWAEKDLLGTVHIKMQHEGEDAFDFVQIQYHHLYTSNAHQGRLGDAIIKLLGGAAASEPEKCSCGDRDAAACPGEWEPGCDLGNNPKFAVAVRGYAEGAALMARTTSDNAAPVEASQASCDAQAGDMPKKG